MLYTLSSYSLNIVRLKLKELYIMSFMTHSNQKIWIGNCYYMVIEQYEPSSDRFTFFGNVKLSLFTQTVFETNETRTHITFKPYHTKFSQSFLKYLKSIGVQYHDSQITTTKDIRYLSYRVGATRRSLIKARKSLQFQLRPYIAESTGSRPISKVKLLMAGLVVRWETTCESSVLQFLFLLFCNSSMFISMLYSSVLILESITTV